MVADGLASGLNALMSATILSMPSVCCSNGAKDVAMYVSARPLSRASE